MRCRKRPVNFLPLVGELATLVACAPGRAAAGAERAASICRYDSSARARMVVGFRTASADATLWYGSGFEGTGGTGPNQGRSKKGPGTAARALKCGAQSLYKTDASNA